MPNPDGQPALVHLRWVEYADLLIAKPRDDKNVTEPKGVGISLNFSMFNGAGSVTLPAPFFIP